MVATGDRCIRIRKVTNMSLTSFIDEKDVKAKFREEFPTVRFKLENRPIIEPLSKNYQLVGTAFDYLLRFRLQQYHPHALARGWVADHARGYLGDDPHSESAWEK